MNLPMQEKKNNIPLVANDAEAWQFLAERVFVADVPWTNSFRIHTNKKGIKLYIELTNEELNGRYESYIQMRDKVAGKTYWHPEVTESRPWRYYGTVTCPTLTECVNHHISELRGPITEPSSTDDLWADVVQYPGTAEEFKAKFNIK